MNTPIEPIVFKYKSATCELILWDGEDTGKASLSEVHSAVKGQGHATQMLNEVIRYADDHSLTIVSAAEPYGYEPGSLNLRLLMNFYKKFGFVFTSDEPDNTFMERTPK